VFVSKRFVFETIVIVHKVLLNMDKKVKITGKEGEFMDNYAAVLKCYL
jgi:hypothetical protein